MNRSLTLDVLRCLLFFHLILPAQAFAFSGSEGADSGEGSGMFTAVDAATDKLMCSQAARGPVLAFPNATATLNSCGTYTVAPSDLCTSAANGIPCLDSNAQISSANTTNLATRLDTSGVATYLPRWQSTYKLTPSVFIDDTSGTAKVDAALRLAGLGDSTASVRRALVVGAGTTGIYGQISLSQSITGSYYAGSVFGFHGLEDHNSIDMTGTVNAYASLALSPVVGGSSNYDHVKAGQFWPTYASVGSINALYGLDVLTTNSGGTVNYNMGIAIHPPGGTGTVQHNYGLYIEDQTKGADSWAIYSVSPTPSYLAGPLELGVAGYGAYNLSMRGSMILTDSLLRIGDAGVLGGAAATGNSQIDYYTGKSLTISESGASRVKITPTGVGIGPTATAPTATLSVATTTANALDVETGLGLSFASWKDAATHTAYAAQNLMSMTGDFQLMVWNSALGWSEALRAVRSTGNLYLPTFHKLGFGTLLPLAEVDAGPTYDRMKVLAYDDGTYVSGMGAYSTDILRIFGTDYDKIITFGSQTMAGAFTEGMRLTAGDLAVAKSITTGKAGGTNGALKLAGSTSGTVTIQPSAAAGTWTMTMPSASGTTGQALVTTNGAGAMGWASVATASGTTNKLAKFTGASSLGDAAYYSASANANYIAQQGANGTVDALVTNKGQAAANGGSTTAGPSATALQLAAIQVTSRPYNVSVIAMGNASVVISQGNSSDQGCYLGIYYGSSASANCTAGTKSFDSYQTNNVTQSAVQTFSMSTQTFLFGPASTTTYATLCLQASGGSTCTVDDSDARLIIHEMPY